MALSLHQTQEPAGIGVHLAGWGGCSGPWGARESFGATQRWQCTGQTGTGAMGGGFWAPPRGRGRERSLALQEAHGVWALCWTPSSWAAPEHTIPMGTAQPARGQPRPHTGNWPAASSRLAGAEPEEWSMEASGSWDTFARRETWPGRPGQEAPGKNLLRGARRAQDSSLGVAKKQQVKRTLLWATHIWAGGARCACRLRNTA